MILCCIIRVSLYSLVWFLSSFTVSDHTQWLLVCKILFCVLTKQLVLSVFLHTALCVKVTNSECLVQLLMAVGAVHIARPSVDYHSYLSQVADSHSEG